KLFSVAAIVLIAFALFVGISQIQDSSIVHAAKPDDRFNELENFSQALSIIQNNYVENVTDGELIEGAIKGMLQSLDPHSAYFTPDQYKSFMVDMAGEFGGLGMTVSSVDNAITIIAPIEDTPAYKAGLKSNDMVYMIDNTSTSGMNTDEAVKLMRGKPGTSVTLTILRKGESKPLVFTIVRDIIKIKSVKHSIIQENIGLIRLTSFQEKSGEEVRNAMQALEKQGATGYILDLRSNPGGSLSEAINVSSLFLPTNVPVVSTKDRDEKGTTLNTKSFSYRNTKQPLIILVNEGSASASEIVAGAMQDHERGVVVGTNTFGKASVQTLVDLRNGGAMKLTTARYYTPKGRSIQGVGIVPDIVVPQGKIVYSEMPSYMVKEKDLAGHLVGEDEKKSESKAPHTVVPQDNETDLQLQSAIQMIKGLSLYSNDEK
ncbi:MAG: S41 family peptidase, partial [Deferribacteraceae bacterium]|nr:S41 family peptidase [Deferribacteraceae bacterium]